MSFHHDIYRQYNDYFHKVINDKVKPPKPKYIRKIILKTYQDTDLKHFFNVLAQFNRSLKPIYYLKVFIMVHNVMRSGNMMTETWDKFAAYFTAHLPSNLTKNIYYEMAVSYGVYLKYKSTFHRRAPHFKGNLKTEVEGDVLPFSELSDCLTLLTMVMLYFQAACFVLDKFISKVKTGFNLSLSQEGQCTLFPIIAVVLDAIGIYNALYTMFERLIPVLNCSELEVPLTQFQEAYDRFRKQIEIISRFTYLSNMLEIPEYPDKLPWDVSDLRKNFEEVKPVVTLPPVVEQKKEIDLNEVISQLKIQNQILQQNYNELVEHSKKFKKMFVDKYNSDVSSLNIQIEQLVEDNKSNLILLENMKKMDHTKDLDERFGKLKNLYFELRKEYGECNEKLMSVKSDLEKSLKDIDDKKSKITDLSKLLDQATEKADMYEIDVAKKNLELEKLKDEAKESSVGFGDKVTRLNQELQFVTQKHKDEIRDCEARIIQLEQSSGGSSLEKYITGLFLRKLDDTELSLNTSSDTQATSAEMERALANTIKMLDGYFSGADESKYDSAEMGLIFEITSQFFEVLRTMRGVANTCSSEHSTYIMKKFNELVTSLREILKLVECNDLPNYKFMMYQLLTELQALREYTNTLPEISLHTESTPEDVIFHTKGKVKEATALLHYVIKHTSEISNEDPMILQNCKILLSLIEELIDDSENLQKEIISEGGNMSGTKEFYKKHHRWTEGLISAAKGIGGAAVFLVHTADKVMNGSASLEELIVASGDITANTASLVASSHTKADPYSKLLTKLVGTSARINKASSELVHQSKCSISKRDECSYIDMTNMSNTKAKRLEMNSQIRVLELEAQLEKERNNLLSIRSNNYHRESDTTD